ncbi:MAG TPA: hybrid sensor histidine kinase/response regulator [Methanoregula sp.]|nr:hybrid sensor histidine kinase/response regulator [Methanoregula sp.]
MTQILIADDNPQNLYLLESILRGHGFAVVPAKNGAEALDAALENPPDLIVTDILMPVMDGFELCRRWKKDERLKHIPFMFYTATYTDTKDEQFAKSLGADNFVIKPQKPEALGRIVCDMVREFSTKGPGVKRPSIDEMESLRLHNEVLIRKLERRGRQLDCEVFGHRQAEEKSSLANTKLALMTEVANQDIQNKISALRGFTELSRCTESGIDRVAVIEKQIQILDTIQNLIKKTRDYQQMGMVDSRWIEIEPIVRLQMSLQSQKHSVALKCDLPGLEILTDPLIARVFYNLIHNTIRHGGDVTRVSFSCREVPEGLVLVCEDDGIGIQPDHKDTLFDRISGGEGKFGLFFVREFLTLSGMTIRENGNFGHGARFEIIVPYGMYRFS